MIITALLISCSQLHGVIIFDSYTPPNTQGGFSSGNAGGAIEVSIASDIQLTKISILNEMLQSGNIRFVIYSYPQPDLLLLTESKPFSVDTVGVPTWKDSDLLSFTLNAGREYLIGYVRDTAVNDVGDTVAESSGGVTSNLYLHCLDGFQSPIYSHPCIEGIDFGVRLHSVPEPSICALLSAACVLVGCRRRRTGSSYVRVLGVPGQPAST